MRQVITGISCATGQENQELICLEESLRKALTDSKIEITDINRNNIGIFLGTTFSNFCIRKNNFDKFNKLGIRAVNPADFPRLLISYLGGCLSIKFGTKGAMSVLSSGDSSGLDALEQALFFLKRDKKNIAVVIDLDEAWRGKSPSKIISSVCLICESVTSKSHRKVYADILGIQNYFEKKNEISGICKCIKKGLEFSLSQKLIPQFFSSGSLRSRKYILEKKALQSVCQDKKFKLLPAKSITNSSLTPLYDIFKERNRSYQKKLSVSLFLNVGEDVNSICVATRQWVLLK